MAKKQSITKKCRVAKLEQFAGFMVEMDLHLIQENPVQVVGMSKMDMEKILTQLPKTEEERMAEKLEALPKTDEEKIAKKLFDVMGKSPQTSLLKALIEMPPPPMPPMPPVPIIVMMHMDDYKKIGRPSIGDTVTVTLVKEPNLRGET